MNNLNNRKIVTTKPKDRDHYINDGGGLRVRIKPSGTKLFEQRYNLYGKKYSIGIGTFPETSLKEARARSFEIRRMVDAGQDPKLERKKKEDQQRAASLEKTVQDLFDDWMTSYVTPHRKRPDQVDEFLRKDVLPFVGKIQAKAIERRHIVQIINRIVDRGALRKANIVLSLVKQMFSHGAAKGFVDQHPCPDLQKKHFGIKTESKQRFLSDEDISELFEKLPDSGLPERTQYAVLILLGTGQRTGELRQATWDNVNTETRIWIIPEEHSKTGKPHKVHLSDFVLEYFERLRALSVDDLVLGSYRSPGQPLNEKTLTKSVRDRQMEAPLKNRTALCNQSLLLAGGPWSLHCLRHSAHTGIGGLGVAPYVVEKILNHTMPGIMAVYNHQEYWPERVDALNKWGEHLRRLRDCNMENVVPLRG